MPRFDRAIRMARFRDIAREVLPVVRNTPVPAGVNGTDPFCLFDSFLDRLIFMGFSGVQNFPTVGSLAGLIRAKLEEKGMSCGETGMSCALEVGMIALTHRKRLLTTPCVRFAGNAAVLAVNPDHLVPEDGGPVLEPADTDYILASTRHCHGLWGDGSPERLPTKGALPEQTRASHAIGFAFLSGSGSGSRASFCTVLPLRSYQIENQRRPQMLTTEGRSDPLAVGQQAARAAGEVLMAHYTRRQALVIDAKGVNDFVSQADRDAEAAVFGVLAARFPQDRLLGEETGFAGGSGNGLTWCIDPLDGGSNVLKGAHNWCVSIGSWTVIGRCWA